MKAKLLFVCHEGFAYVAWQRVEVWLATPGDPIRFNVSHTIADLLNGTAKYGAHEKPSVLIKADGCIFVESGESFTLTDFADAIATDLGFEYITQDGEDVENGPEQGV